MKNVYRELCAAHTNEEEIHAIHYFIGAFYWNCGNERLDKSMSALRAQQLMVRNMAVRAASSRCEEIDDFSSMLSLAENNDTDALCATIESYSAKITEKAKKYLSASASLS